ALASVFLAALTRLVLFDATAGVFLGLLASLLDGALFFLAALVLFQQRGAATGFLVGLPRVLQHTHTGRVLLGCQRARRSAQATRRLSSRFRRRSWGRRLRPSDGGRGCGFGMARLRSRSGRD